MKINRISAIFLSMGLLCSPFFSVAEKKATPTWGKESQAVYDLLVAQMQNADADYAGSVDTLVRFAKTQKDDRLLAKAYRSLLQTERYAEAVDIAKVWQKNSKLDVEKFYVLALVLNKETDKALSVIEKSLSKNAANAEPSLLSQDDKTHFQEAKLFAYVQLLMSNWYHPQVLTVLKRLYQDYPDSGSVSKAYVNLLRFHGDIDQAIKVVDQFLFKSPKDLALLQEKSDSYRYGLRLTDAENVWKNSLKDYPNNAKLRFAYAQFLYDKYDFQAAQAQLQQLPKNSEDFSQSLLKMMVAVQLGEYETAEKAFRWSQLDTEEKDNAHYNYGDKLLQKKQYDLALKQLQQVSEKGKLALPAALKIGRIHYAKNLSEGNQWFADLQEKYRLENDVLVKEKAAAMEAVDKQKEAYQLLNAYLEKHPKNEDVRYVRALLAAEMHLDSQAIEDLKRLYATAPDNTDIQNALGYTLLTEPKELAYGTRLIKKSLFSNPASPAVVDSMGWANYQQKQYQAALPYFRYAYGLYLDGEIIGHYIMGLMASGQTSLAKKLYQLEIQYLPNKEKIQQITQSVQEELES